MGNPKQNREGSAYLLVLLVMISSLSLVSSTQHVLIRRTRQLEQTQVDAALRNALLLATQEAGRLLLEDEDPTVDGLQDAWMLPLEYQSTDGVSVFLKIEDAQTRFNLNHLSLSVPRGFPKTWMELFQDLVQSSVLEIEPQRFQEFQQQIDEEEIWFENPEALRLYLPELSQWIQESDLVSALPRPSERPLPLNINTVNPAVLSAVVGTSMDGWVESVLKVRSTTPIRNISAISGSLPPQLQPLLSELFDVRSELFFARIVAQKDQSEANLSVLFRRSHEGVEVLRCQW